MWWTVARGTEGLLGGETEPGDSPEEGDEWGEPARLARGGAGSLPGRIVSISWDEDLFRPFPPEKAVRPTWCSPSLPFLPAILGTHGGPPDIGSRKKREAPLAGFARSL